MCQHSMRPIIIRVGRELSIPDMSMAEVEGIYEARVCVWEDHG